MRIIIMAINGLSLTSSLSLNLTGTCNSLTSESTCRTATNDLTQDINMTSETDKDDVTEYMYRPDPNLRVNLPADRPTQKHKISKLEKFIFYFTAFFFWILSFLTVGVGIYIYHERTLPVLQLLKVHIDPSCILIVFGLIALILTTGGFVGALRENTCLLKLFAYGLLILVALQIAFLVLVFLFFYTNVNITVDPKSTLSSALQLYSEDDDMRDIMDFVQINFHCCGISDDGYLDWRLNPYFNCSWNNPSNQRCGVPFSCCRMQAENPMNTLCGFDVTNETLTLFEVQHRIYTDGCVHAIIRLLQENAFLTAANIFGTTILMFIGVFSAARMAAQVQKNKEYHALVLQTTCTTPL